MLKDLLKEIHGSSSSKKADPANYANLFADENDVEFDQMEDIFISNEIDNVESLIVDDNLSRRLGRGLIGNDNDPLINDKYDLKTYLDIIDYTQNLKSGKTNNDLDEKKYMNVLDSSLDLTSISKSQPIDIKIKPIVKKAYSLFAEFYG
jgi:hypothetical protein